MKQNKFLPLLLLCSAVFAGFVSIPNIASADPCGMVPPVQVRGDGGIKRINAQKTYVFHRDGIESLAVRPGFEGSVEDFGMLIPFPEPPAIRTLPDNIFQHIGNAIDPPVKKFPIRRGLAARGAVKESARVQQSMKVKKDEVKVVRQEAVGMYNVAVLDAGSAEALEKWMNEHDYKYPMDMDAPVNDYIDREWSFVAVKARIGQRKKVDPKPGMENADPSLDEGDSYDGHVQAMGFRFHSEKPVAPMRLSAHNEGKLHNIVYLLTESPMKVDRIPEEFVQRQVSGKELYRNLTSSLPVAVPQQMIEDNSEEKLRNRVKQFMKNRNLDPDPHMKHARNLFASDLFASKKDRLTHPFEETIKELANIGEHLNLRDESIDQMNRKVVAGARERAREKGLELLKDMTMTVVDGDFRRKVVAEHNITFSPYEMPEALNTSVAYNARKGEMFVNGSSQKSENFWRSGPGRDHFLKVRKRTSFQKSVAKRTRKIQNRYPRLYFRDLDTGNMLVRNQNEKKMGIMPEKLPGKDSTGEGLGWLMMIFLIIGGLCTGFLFSLFIPRGSSSIFILAVGTTFLLGTAGTSWAETGESKRIEVQVEKLSDDDKAPQAVSRLVEIGLDAIPFLLQKAQFGNSLTVRGWAIVALSRIQEPSGYVTQQLKRIEGNTSNPELLRTWTAAAIIQRADNIDELGNRIDFLSQYPALVRPIKLKAKSFQTSQSKILKPLVTAVSKNKNLQNNDEFINFLQSFPLSNLLNLQFSLPANQGRQTIAKIVGGIARNGQTEKTCNALLDTLKFRPGEDEVPWKGGALFLPRIQYNQQQAKSVAKTLIKWIVWAKRNGRSEAINQIHNNLRSVSLARTAGYDTIRSRSGNASSWLRQWKDAFGEEEVRTILNEQNALNHSAFQRILK